MAEKGRLLSGEQGTEILPKLLGRIVHDFNNPLAAIIGFSDLLRNPALAPEKRSRYVERIYEQATKLAQLVETMSHFSSSPTPDVASVDLARAVKDVCSLREGGMQASHIEFDVSIEGDVGHVLCERGAVGRIVHALLNNVEQIFRENPLIDARRAQVRCGTDGGRAFVDVSDSGPGVAPELADQIFEPFFSTRRSGGLGLGLTISRTLAEQMGGRLDLLAGDERLAGARFRLLLPLAEEE